MYCSNTFDMHEAIILLKTIGVRFEWPYKTGFTVISKVKRMLKTCIHVEYIKF